MSRRLLVINGSPRRGGNVATMLEAIEREAVGKGFDVAVVRMEVVLIGGGLIGCEVALHLAELDKEVTILEISDKLARDANMFHRPTMFECMEKKKDKIHSILNASTTAIKKNGVVYNDASGNEQFVEADTMLYAVGSIADTAIS